MVHIATLPESTTAQQALGEQTLTNQTANQPTATNGRFPRQGEWTYEDWLELPDDGWKYEIIDGVLYMSPPPLIDHQAISIELSSRMHFHAQRKKLGIVLTAPCGVRLPAQPVPVEPDILFVKRERRSIVHKRYVEGAPDLVVEILSPSNASYDEETKFKQYQAAGVPEYWLINGWDRLVKVYHLENAAYDLVGTYGINDVVKSIELQGFNVEAATLFAQLGEEDV